MSISTATGQCSKIQMLPKSCSSSHVCAKRLMKQFATAVDSILASVCDWIDIYIFIVIGNFSQRYKRTMKRRRNYK